MPYAEMEVTLDYIVWNLRQALIDTEMRDGGIVPANQFWSEGRLYLTFEIFLD
jgi:hypothetical protein